MQTQQRVVRIFGIYVTVNNTKILSAVQKRFYGETVSPPPIHVLKSSCRRHQYTYSSPHVAATNTRTQVFMYSARPLRPIYTKTGVSRQIFIEAPVFNFTEIRLVGGTDTSV